MASQVAHIIYSQRYFDRLKSGEFKALPNQTTRKYLLDHKDEFMLGCIFPDIRRIDGKLSRKQTHLCFDSVDLNFEKLNAFEAGWKFHLYCDMRREEILGKYDFYSIKGAADFWHIPSKLFEDELVYDRYANWEKLVNYFNNIPPLKIDFVSRETLSLWYAINAKYFEKKPDSRSMGIFLSKLPSLAGIANEATKIIDELRKNKKVVEILSKVKDEIL